MVHATTTWVGHQVIWILIERLVLGSCVAGMVKMWDQRLRHEVASVQVGTVTSDPTGGESGPCGPIPAVHWTLALACLEADVEDLDTAQALYWTTEELRREPPSVTVFSLRCPVGAIAGIALRPDGFLLTTGSFDTLVSVLDVRTWRLLHSLEVCRHTALQRRRASVLACLTPAVMPPFRQTFGHN